MKVLYETKGISELRIVEYKGKESVWKFGVECRPVIMNPEPGEQEKEEWGVMGGTVDYYTSEFRTHAEAIAFLKKGLKGEEENPEIWLEMLEC